MSIRGRARAVVRAHTLWSVKPLIVSSLFLWISTALCAMPAWSLDLKQTLLFKLPAQPLESALIAFGEQAHVQVVITPEVGPRVNAPAVSGMLPAGDVLKQLLGTSGFQFKKIGDTVMVVPESATATSRKIRRAAADETPSVPSSDATTAALHSDDMAEVTITGHYEFLSVDTSGATNLPLPIEKVPQSISLVSNDFIQAADLKTLGEIAEYTPGAVYAGNGENYGTGIQLRGFFPATAIDGLPFSSGGAPYEPDYAIYDRLEVVKGPSSLVYGASSAGGLVNFVTKSPTPDTHDYVYVQAGSWDSYRVEGQIAGALDADGHLRAIGLAVYDRGHSFIDEIFRKKVSLYGGLNGDFGHSVTGYIHGGYERFERTSFDGIPTESDGTPAPLPRSYFIGSPNIIETTSVYHAEGGLTWHATEVLDVSLKGNYFTSRTLGENTFSEYLQPNGDISLQGYNFSTAPGLNTDNYAMGASAIYRFDTLGLKKSFLSVGALYQNNRTIQDLQFDPTVPTTNIFLGEAAISQAFDSLLATTNGTPPYSQLTKSSTLTFSAQSVLQLLDPLSLLLGVSYSKPNTTQDNSGVLQNFDLGYQKSYRAGLTYEFLAGANAYVSFSQSFAPQALDDVSGEVVPPTTGDQYEAGVKYRTREGRLLLTGAVFRIKEKNLAEYVSTNANGINVYVTAGEVTNKGLEFQALGHITPQWQINVGYSYLDPKITGAVTSGTFAQPDTVGQTSNFIPKQTASLYTTCTIAEGRLRGLSVSVGARYVGSQRTSYESALANSEAGLTPSKDLPQYALVDAGAGYEIRKGWLVQLNMHNIFDRHYFINNYQSLLYGNAPGEPRNVTLSVRGTL